ncbi:MAG: hypothetical protein K0R38_5092 [Polyangiaceae bacterium]|jgi:hypothetical protein|nr:hypothetical protein [Polyangiaceae bacterium]
MRQILLGLGVSAVFAAGCVAGATSLAVPKAKAAHVEEQRWAYFCFDAQNTEDVHFKANAAGARGWEMVSGIANPGGGSSWCFRQPRP